MTFTHRRAFCALIIALMGAIGPAAFAQGEWPTAKPITWVVPYPPGGSTDILGRAIALRLAKALGTPVVVENKAGATGTIGSAFVAKAVSDGYTLLGTSIGPQAIVPNLVPSMAYDAVRAFEPITLIGTIPHVLVIGAASPFRTVADLVGEAKAKPKPKTLSFASGGNGTILQMQGELLAIQTGTRMTHVPYKGDTPAIQDVLAGHQSGRLRALAVTSANRLKALPDVQTMTQAGYKDFVVEQWQAAYAPAGTPKPVVQRLNQEVLHALKDPDITAMADKLGVTLVGSSPQQLADTQKTDLAKWGKLIKDAGIKAD